MTETQKYIITDKMRTRIRELGNRYPDFQSALIPALWMVQYEHGSISVQAMEEVAKIFGIHPAHVESVLSFYTMFFSKPVGKHLIQVCRSVSCMLRGSDDLLEKIEEYLGVKPDETTSDGVFTLIVVECLGACGGAPVVQLDYEYHENMTWEKVKELIDKTRDEALKAGVNQNA
jgi:NADH-quinone oxidoreductase subunit E